MENNDKNKKKSSSETMLFDVHKFSNLQCMKVIFMDTNDGLRELSFDVISIDSSIIKLSLNGDERVNLTCPTGVVLKLATHDAVYFAKSILKIIKKINDKLIFVLQTPNKTIRQQNRKFYRISASLPGVMLIKDDKNGNQTYIAQSVNISKGGVLLGDAESLLNDEKKELQLSAGDHCHIAMFLKHNLKIKSYAKFIRTECVDDTYRYAFQFINISKASFDALDKYVTKEKLNLFSLMDSD